VELGLQPSAHVVVVVGAPVALHTTRSSVWHCVVLGAHALHESGAPPAPQP
jgi:hypothetical protein